MVEETFVLAMASGQSTVPNLTGSSALSPPPQAPNTNALTTSKRPSTAALINLPPLSTDRNPFSHPQMLRAPHRAGASFPTPGQFSVVCESFLKTRVRSRRPRPRAVRRRGYRASTGGTLQRVVRLVDRALQVVELILVERQDAHGRVGYGVVFGQGLVDYRQYPRWSV